MMTKPALPVAADRRTCTECGIIAPAPIVSKDRRCANEAACAKRRAKRAARDKAIANAHKQRGAQ